MARLHIAPGSAAHTHTVILLHGRDSIASEFADEFFESQASDDRTLQEIFPNIKWVFPASGLRTSARFGCDMSQWFDMWSTERPEERKDMQLAGLCDSIDFIFEVIQQEASLVGADRVILAGISQGCATAIHALLQGGPRIGGFVGFSAWLPFQAEVEEIAQSLATPAEKQSRLCRLFREQHPPREGQIAALGTPVLLAHCQDDDVIPVQSGEKLCKALAELGMGVEWHAYEDGGHWVNEPQGIDDIVAFLEKVCA